MLRLLWLYAPGPAVFRRTSIQHSLSTLVHIIDVWKFISKSDL